MVGDKKGFTLIELIVAIGILAVLVVVGLMAVNPVVQLNKSRDARRKSDLAQIKRALQMYHNDQGVFPASIPGKGAIWTHPTEMGMVYMKSIPGDPRDGSDYLYAPASTFQDYCLRAELQNTGDPDISESQARCSSACALALVTFGKNDYAVCAD